MAHTLHQLFTPSDLDRIAEAVTTAERGTSGEIVPYVVAESDAYTSAIWRAASVFGAAALFILAAAQQLLDIWIPLGLIGAALVVLGAALLGALLVFASAAMRRLFAGRETIEHRTAQRALEAFVAEEVFRTRDRTGILIFLSLLEHRVVVLGDSGINAKVKKEEWENVVGTIVDGIRNGRPAAGLITAITICGELLSRRGVHIRPDDTDELSNKLRIGES